MLLNELNYDVIETIFNNLYERKDIYNFLLINKYFNNFKNNFNSRVIKIIFLIQNWFHSKYIKEMEIIGIMLWSKQFLDTINDNDKKLLKYILDNINNVITNNETIKNNLYKQIIYKKYKYRKTNRTYNVNAYNIIDICFSKVLNMI
jgi:hypothetical protein